MRRDINKKSGRHTISFMLELILALLLLSACGKAVETAEESSQAQPPGIQGTEADVSEETPAVPAGGDRSGGEEVYYENACDAYFTKCQELSRLYGSGRLVECPVDNDGRERGCCYMSGLCFVDLIDFTGSGVKDKDLLVVYSKGQDMGLNSQGMEIPRAGNYCMEVWTYEKGKLKLLVSADHVSSYPGYQNKYWDTDNCFLTVYEDSYEKMAVIQIYEDTPEGDVYTNYYCYRDFSGYELKCDIYASKDGKYYENGEETDLWRYEMVCDYDVILAGVQLSASDYGREGLAKFGVDMSYGLAQSTENMQALSDDTFRSVMKVGGAYFGAYMKILLGIRHETFGEGSGFKMPEFTLHDMDGNGVPELIVNIAPNEAGAECRVYTCVNDRAVSCGAGYSGHSTFYIGPGGGLVRTEGHMDVYHYEKWDLEGTELVITEFAGGVTEPEKGYPPLENYGYRDYNREVWFWKGDLSTLLYMSGLDALDSWQKFEETVSATADTEYQYAYEDLDHDGEQYREAAYPVLSE